MSEPLIPAELLLPTPRTTRRRKPKTIWTYLIAYPFYLLLCLMAAAWVVYSAGEIIALSQAKLAEGQISGLRTSVSHGRHSSTTYFVDYQFMTAAGMQASSQSVSSAAYHQLHAGQPIDVRLIQIGSYATSELDLVYGHLFRERWSAWLITVVFAGLVSLVIFGLWRQHWLVRSGTPILGSVVSKRITEGKSTIYYVKYALPTRGGSVTRSESVSATLYETLADGDAVCVLHDPNHPKRSLLYAACRLKCVDGQGN